MTTLKFLKERFDKIPKWCETAIVYVYHKSDEIPFTSKVLTSVLLFDKSGKSRVITKDKIKRGDYDYKGFDEFFKFIKDLKNNGVKMDVVLCDEQLIDNTHYYEILQSEMVSDDEMRGYRLKAKAKVNKPKCKKFPKLNVEGMF